MSQPTYPKNLTIPQIAALTGLSTATVDRVLNRRPGVREITRQRVAQVLAQSAATQRPADCGVKQVALIVEAGSGYIELVEDALERVRQRYPQLSLTFDSVLSSARSQPAFSQLIGQRSLEADALVLVSREDVAVSARVRQAVSNGKPVMCMTTDVTGSSGFVGVDEIAAGANAAFLMGSLLNARTEQNELLLVASSTYRCQEERETGFRRVMRSAFPSLKIHEKIVANDEAEQTQALMAAYLRQHPQVGGIYNTAGGNPGIAQAIAQCGPAQKIFFIGHELNRETRQLLEQQAMDIVFHRDVGRELEIGLELILQSGGSVKEQRVTLPALFYTQYSIS